MYVSLVDSRAKGFVKWGDAYQRERPNDAAAGAAENAAVGALDLDREAVRPAEQAPRP
jgi:hypothetical protein